MDKASIDEQWMRYALSLADKAEQLNEVPVGAVVVLAGEVIGEGWNHPITGQDPTAHAEIMALQSAARAVGNYRLVGADLYVTIEPCTMCAGAIVHARINRLIYGATELKSGAVESNCQLFKQPWVNHQVDVTSGVLAKVCGDKISAFFQRRRDEKRAIRLAARSAASD
ncbi:MAG: tRNA adenosine(34) deaminase TadA [Neptuniibacter caesariensis]|uniref:tRNA-specific adenosine deaminase n=1 Tax=Neptuniibacter caesariensis TaxID=207954 RepID=A0A2G6JNC2_NEPCE|nr:MAG: tRNA adenosine(34) deaminase TadA [Neptuniibacter caesariensis]